MGKVPKGTLLFLAHFYPHNPKQIFFSSGMTKKFCQNILDRFSQEKNGEIKMKSQKMEKGGPEEADFFHTAKIGKISRRKKAQNSVVV